MRQKTVTISAFFALLAALFSVQFALGAQAQVQITADNLVIEEDKNIATFTGNVVIIQAELKVRSQKVVVHYGSGGAADIDTLEAIGSVRVDTPDQQVTGDRGIYDPETRIMHMIGNVTTISASGTVTSSELEVNFATNTTAFTTTGGGRVTGVFNP